MSAGSKDLTHREKVAHLLADLSQRGMSPYTFAPPFFRMLWAMGFNVPPPLFLGFRTLTLGMGALFGLFWGVFMYQLQWEAWQMTLRVAVLTAAGAGLAFGLSMATYYRWKAEILQLPPWENYPGA
jgi:phosphatidylglycerophosphate synthase